jgi:single-strand DNA-binding protein
MVALLKVTVIGNLGSDPTLRYLQDGTPVCSFTIAVNSRKKDQETTTWLKVTAWRKQAELVSELLKKGMSVYVSGALTTSEFTGQDGTKRFSLDVNMDEFQILTPKGQSEPAMPSGPVSGYTGNPSAMRDPHAIDDLEGDIPF